MLIIALFVIRVLCALIVQVMRSRSYTEELHIIIKVQMLDLRGVDCGRFSLECRMTESQQNTELLGTPKRFPSVFQKNILRRALRR